MAEDQVGLRQDNLREPPAWTKLFTAFKVALDHKKLLLAAAGIFVMSFGWWLLSALFFFMFDQTPPKDLGAYEAKYDNKQDAWKAFKLDRNRWNLRYKMAGPVPSSLKEADEVAKVDAVDLAGSPAEYEAIKGEEDVIRREVGRRLEKVELKARDDGKEFWLVLPGSLQPDKGKTVTLNIKTDSPALLAELKKETDKPGKALKAEEIVPAAKSQSEGKAEWLIRTVRVEAANAAEWQAFFNLYSKAPSLRDIEQQIRQRDDPRKREIGLNALSLVDPAKTRYKPAGQLRTWPWFEDRGPNPYLLVTGNVASEGREGLRSVPWERGEFLGWLASDQLPVLVEPLVKFLRPILYLFDPASGGLNRIYLFAIILWTLATWALFGGAITRLAAVHLARPNEQISMTEAVRFTWARYRSYFSAPLFPLLFIVVLTVFLILFGLVEGLTWFLGDIFVAGLFWPLVLVIGLIMAVVLVGLIGWPLMYPTISAEGSDSFDAISRSYSYVYQSPWRYLWYAAVALAYGAVLVFFVGFMGSLMVYLSKWGISQAPLPSDREPTYLFSYAPTSFGWRDLLLSGHPDAVTVEVVRSSGAIGKELALSPQYMETISLSNRIGAFLVAFWIYVLFLMVVGFAYSYFWTASTLIYLLMRRSVDETEMDEVHLDEEEFEEPPPRTTTSAPAQAAAQAPAGGGRAMVDAPAFRTPAAPPQNVTAPPPTPTAAPPPDKTQIASEPPPISAPKTQLATEPPGGGDGPSASSEPPAPGHEGEPKKEDGADGSEEKK
ncbi:MAG: hypothetical protein L0Z62_47950 [Gemmataceae bacterium]|nr:hypothetical protein [Gemmataceae bacterium]